MDMVRLKTFGEKARDKLERSIAYVRGFFAAPELYFRAGARRIVMWGYKPTYIDMSHIPDTGAAVIICNHVSYMDGMVIQAGVPNRRVRFIIDGHIYKVPGVHYFMNLNGAIPILPTRESVTAAFDEVAKALEEGDVVCIFPEGQLTYRGSLSRFRHGIEHIIKRTPVPIYPMAINGLWGSFFSRKYNKSWRRFFPQHLGQKVTAICGEPINPENINKDMLQNEVLRLKYKIMEEAEEESS